jgi:hypothetical protein
MPTGSRTSESILDAPAQLVEAVVEAEWLLPVAKAKTHKILSLVRPTLDRLSRDLRLEVSLDPPLDL